MFQIFWILCVGVTLSKRKKTFEDRRSNRLPKHTQMVRCFIKNWHGGERKFVDKLWLGNFPLHWHQEKLPWNVATILMSYPSNFLKRTLDWTTKLWHLATWYRSLKLLTLCNLFQYSVTLYYKVNKGFLLSDFTRTLYHYSFSFKFVIGSTFKRAIKKG